MTTRREIVFGLGALAGLMSLPSLARAGADDLTRISGRAFGTRWQVTVPADADLVWASPWREGPDHCETLRQQLQ